MAQFQAMTLKNGATPSVDTVFEPTSRNADIVRWDNRTAGIVAGFKTVTMSCRPSGKAGNYRVLIKIEDPRLAVTAPNTSTGIQPNPVAAYFTTAKLEFLIPAASDSLARADALAYASALLAQNQIVDAVKNLNPPI